MSEEALLAAVLASPDDDAPRLVFADWLLEHGDAFGRAHGELIQVQCALAHVDEPSPARTRLVRRAARLVADARSEWCDAVVDGWGKKVAAGELEVAFERGFLSSIGVGSIGTPYMIRSWRLLEDLPRALEKTPLARMEIGCVGLDLPAIFDAPSIARLRELKLSIRWLEHRVPAPGAAFDSLKRLCVRVGAEVALDELAPIVESPHLASLESLSIESREELATLVSTIADAPCARSLKALSLSGRTLGDLGLARLLAGGFDRLESLSLHVDDVGVIARALVEPSAFPRLRELRLAPASKAWSSTDALAILGARPSIDALHLGGGDARTLWSLLAHPSLPRLRALGLTRHGLDDDDVRALAGETSLDGLRVLDLAGNEIRNDGVRQVAEAPQFATLRSLSFARNPVDGGAWLARSPYLEGLEELDLRDAGTRVEPAEILRTRFGASVRIGASTWYHEDD